MTGVASDRESRLFAAYAVCLTLAVAAAFYVPALRATGGDWPAPLDDVFIHFDFARALARGAPFEWIPGQGFSSGETAPLYPFLLAPGYAVGFRGLALGVWAAILACASSVLAMHALRRLLAPSPVWVAWIGCALLLSVGVLDWIWFSGMEIAPFGAATIAALAATKRAREASPWGRARAQWGVSKWAVAMVLLRPEAVVVVAPLAIVVARRAGAGRASAALVRSAGAPAVATIAIAGVNLWRTGDAASAGARLKLLSSNPFLSDVDRARELVTSLVYVKVKIVDTMMTASPRLWMVVPSLALVGLASRRTRALTGATLSAALAWTLLVSWNGAARFQNVRYYAPAILLVLVAATLGLAALARIPRLRGVGLATACLGGALAYARLPDQIALFRDASANIHGQQIEVGRRLRVRSEPGVVLVGDAGAIPYVSERRAIDALGLGGYRDVPFVVAAPHGEAAILELIERLTPDERPRFLALYPNWFPRTTSLFGTEIDRVTIANNVICGGPTKGIYLADWSPLAAADDREATFEDDGLDVADVVDERRHAYASPAPHGGWTIADVRLTEDGRRLFDGGRIIPPAQCERFTVAHAVPAAALTLRSDARVDAFLESSGSSRRAVLASDAPSGGAWAIASAALGDVRGGETLSLCAGSVPLRDFHVWLRRGGRVQSAR